MTDNDNTLPNVNELTQLQLSNILYHIGANTYESKKYTREFIERVLIRASNLLSMLYEGERKGDTIKLHQDQREGAYSSISLSDLMEVTHRLITGCRYHPRCERMADHDQVCVADSVTKCRCCGEGQLRCYLENCDWDSMSDEMGIWEVPPRIP